MLLNEAVEPFGRAKSAMTKIKTLSMKFVCLAFSPLIFGVASILPANAASTLFLDDLYQTGLNVSGNTVTPFSTAADAHWMLEGPDFALGAANVINKNTDWIPAPTGSQWIGRADGGQGNTPNGLYTFTTKFDLSGFDYTTASIFGSAASDDTATILLNGNVSGNVNGFGSLTDFFISTGFVDGVNTLQFLVLNSSMTTTNPMGLLVSEIGGTAEVASISAVPLPPSAILFGSALLGLGAIRRRKQKVKNT